MRSVSSTFTEKEIETKYKIQDEVIDYIDKTEFDGIPFSDYLKSFNLSVGDVITFDNGYKLLIGNCTPYTQPTKDDGEVVWDYNHWRHHKVVSVEKIYFKDSDYFFTGDDIEYTG